MVKGEKADPLKVLERVQKKGHRPVELISPIPKPEEAKKPEGKEVVKFEEKKKELPVMTVLLGIYMHCEACAQEIRKRNLETLESSPSRFFCYFRSSNDLCNASSSVYFVAKTRQRLKIQYSIVTRHLPLQNITTDL